MTVDTFFASLPREVPERAAQILTPVLDMKEELARSERRIVLFGAIKTGKTTVLNRVLGARLLAEHARRTAGWITTVGYGQTPHVVLVDEDGSEHPLPFDDLHRAGTGWDSAVRELRLAVPLPLLQSRLTLVDTPGLLANEAATETAFESVERADLAVMVLAADKILSAEERDAAAYVNDLLHGNILFVVNRMDLIDEEDREEVLEWASTALRDMGNPLVGEPRIVTGGTNGWDGDSLARRLSTISESQRMERVAALSRASRLRQRLAGAVPSILAEQTCAAAEAEEARLQQLERTMRERAAARHAIASGKRQLETARIEIRVLDAPFQQQCVEDTIAWVRANPRVRHVRLQIENAVAALTDGVNEKTGAALTGVPIAASPFDLRSWLFRLDLDAGSDPLSPIGSTIGNLLTLPLDHGESGREVGAALGSWISKNVLGKDAEAEIEQEVERLARMALTSIDAEVERHFSHLDSLLDEADTFYEGWMQPSATVEAAEREEREWAALAQWAQGFQRAVRRAIDDAVTAWPEAADGPVDSR